MNSIKITDHQLFSLSASTAIGGSVLVIASTMVGVANQDAWIGALLAPLFGMPILWIYWYIGSQYPEATFIGLIKNVFGKWIGTFVALTYIFQWFNLSFHIPWYIGNHMTTYVIPETPECVINLLFVIVNVVAVLYGIEALARFSEIAIYFTLILFSLAILLVSPNASINNIFPVLENGIVPPLKSSALLLCFTAYSYILVLMIYPVNVQNIKNARRQFFKGYLLCNFMGFASVIMCILVLGSKVTTKYQHPFYLLVKEINVGTIFTRVEFVIAITWLVTQFVLGTLFFYAFITGISEILGLKIYKRIVIPFGVAVLALSEVVFPNYPYQIDWVKMVWIPYATTHGLIIPVLLLITLLIKKKLFKKI